MRKIITTSFLYTLLFFFFSNFTFYSKSTIKPYTSKTTYINFSIDSTSFSYSPLTEPICSANESLINREASTIWSNSIGRPNGSSFQLNIILPKDPSLIINYKTNIKYYVTSNRHFNDEYWPMPIWISYRPDIKSEFGYLSNINNNLNEQFVVYTKMEKGKPLDNSILPTYYMTGYFQCKVKSEDPLQTKFMKGNFRIRVCFDKNED